jgi:hypothetical protein
VTAEPWLPPRDGTRRRGGAPAQLLRQLSATTSSHQCLGVPPPIAMVCAIWTSSTPIVLSAVSDSAIWRCCTSPEGLRVP